MATGLKVTELITSSEQAKLVDGMSSQFNGDKIMDSFLTGSEDGKPVSTRKHTLALKLGGKFTTAFPKGKPATEDAGSAEPGATKPASPEHLTESKEDNYVCLIGDTDILVDDHFILQQRFRISEKHHVRTKSRRSLWRRHIDQHPQSKPKPSVYHDRES